MDPQLQLSAMARATSLIITLGGGKAGPLTAVTHAEHLPVRNPVPLRAARIKRLLGLELETQDIQTILNRLGMSSVETAEGWMVTPPSFRFDIALEADLIEELGRVHGYDRLPLRSFELNADMRPVAETRLELDRIKDTLVDRGYQEAITYSFVDPHWQTLLDPERTPVALKNPISQDLAVMRTTLWVGLLGAALNNVNRQQQRVRFFETGLRFLSGDSGLCQTAAVAGLALGSVMAEQWGDTTRAVDFFDVKADVEALFGFSGHAGDVAFQAARHVALHPGQTAEIRLRGVAVGWLGMLHPAIGKSLGFEQNVYLFEIAQDALLRRTLPRFKSLSRFPSVRRDIAIIVEEAITAGAIEQCVRAIQNPVLRQLSLFDVYRGQGVASGMKSIALACVFQHEDDTLTDAQVEASMAEILSHLHQAFGATLR